jgi:hypothetical protein
MTTVIFGFILALTIGIGYMVLSAWNTQVQATPSMGTTTQTMTQTQTSKYVNLWDGLFGFIFIGMSLAAAISAYFVDTHPIVFFLALIMLAVFIIVAASLANVYNGVETASGFNVFMASFKLMHHIMNNLAKYCLVEGAIILIALFTKARQ